MYSGIVGSNGLVKVPGIYLSPINSCSPLASKKEPNTEMEQSMALNNKETDGINIEDKVDSNSTYKKQGLTGDWKEAMGKMMGGAGRRRRN